jgi:hypothetical protein
MEVAMSGHGTEDKLDEARQHLVEANQHIAHAVERLAMHEAAGMPRDGEAGSEVEQALLLRRRDWLAGVYARVQAIQDDLRRIGRGARTFRLGGRRQPTQFGRGDAADELFAPKRRAGRDH